ncbi:14484_t:CDS:2 [Entrophospora sp. SA101]|nr:14484_t:CDS:2 [Entrophospora sp. SA101]
MINEPLYIAKLHCKISIRKTNIKDLGYESFIKNGSNKRTFINKKLLEPSEEYVLHHNDKILVKTRGGFIATTSYDKSYYNHCIDVRHSKILIAKMGAKAISSVVFEGEKVILSEAQKQITIGRDLAANLTISHPFVASIQCILTIRKTDKMHYVKELNFETVIKNGWNTRTHVNGIQLKWNEEQVLNNNDMISIKVEGGFFYVQFFEDAKTDCENIVAKENNRLPAQSGERHHVINNKDDNQIIVTMKRLYASKIIHVSDAKYDKNRIIEHRNEIDILKILDHENIIKVVDDYFDEENIYIHENHIMHRDIKPDNIMFTDSSFNQVKLIDFGESKKIEGSIDSMGNYIEQTSTELVGIPLFVAPELAKAFKDSIEMFKKGNGSDGGTAQCEYDKSIDIWSFGIVNYYMLSKQYPWNVNNHVEGVEGRSNNYTELYNNIIKGDLDFPTFKTIRSDINEIETVVDFILKLCQLVLTRSQDYCGIVISGRKTRVGFEIKNIVEHNELTKTLKDELNATFEYMYIYSIKNILGPVLEDNSSNKYPQIARTY